MKHLPEPEQDVAYQPLHERYAPEALAIILHLKGFFTKIGQVRVYVCMDIHTFVCRFGGCSLLSLYV